MFCPLTMKLTTKVSSVESLSVPLLSQGASVNSAIVISHASEQDVWLNATELLQSGSVVSMNKMV